MSAGRIWDREPMCGTCPRYDKYFEDRLSTARFDQAFDRIPGYCDKSRFGSTIN